MKFDKHLLRTVLFSLGIVALVIGIYQTIFYNDLQRNYWLFMVAMTCWMPLLYWRQQEALAAKVAAQEAKLAKNKPRPAGGSQKPKKRR
ncbi:hypothetical protein Q5H93_00310 [Hymenobacter sp. ASUV-10]|uniref:Signal peptidase n=1 Tax=Hymenobacter aranciens TaxID=3063996 RepID=A0ABT9B4G9_9BACT|nr:hypothetical protein [Hymenobacter sp. ASUV-10]MDO7873157.1 hypothetical protein [Hymenobacter sp. ASUV-10]